MNASMPPSIDPDEVEFTAIRAQGAGGQNVNKVSTAVHLRFDIVASTLPDDCKARLLEVKDQRITKDGVIVIKAQRYRSQDLNRADALARLQDFIHESLITLPPRKPTKPTRGSTLRRLQGKATRSQVKAGRGKVSSQGE